MITLIACVDLNLGIGNKNNDLLFDLPKDKQFFKSVTNGKTVVMGRKTWDSLPKKPLPNRENYILTRNRTFAPDGAKVIHSVEEALDLARSREVFVIGGGQIYQEFLPFADKLILTIVDTIDPNATVFFPKFSYDEWDLVEEIKHEPDDKHLFSFAFTTYIRKK